MDPQQRLILETSYEALEDAGMIPGLEEERNIGVYSGISTNTYYQLLARYIEKYGAEKLHLIPWLAICITLQRQLYPMHIILLVLHYPLILHVHPFGSSSSCSRGNKTQKH